MENVTQVFQRIEKNKEELKENKKLFLQKCEEYGGYEDLIEQRKKINEEIKKLKSNVAGNNQELFSKIEDLKIDIKSDKEVLNDMVMTKLTKGEVLDITDKEENKYQAHFNFSFKKEE